MAEMLPPWHEEMYNYDCKINRALYRISQIANSERLMGFDASADMYLEMSAEISTARIWLGGVVNEMHKEEVRRARVVSLRA